jgi:2-polyprenyl-6-hydroxyphenyl methylase/3-demethylubiquinone-9 3-methyltransferase
MWKALENVAPLVAEGGKLFIAIYNDQGATSRAWKHIKQGYNALPNGLKFLVLWPCFIRLWGPTTIKDLIRGKPFYTWRTYGGVRGMSPWRDVVDWVGGYPFEVAKPEDIFDYFQSREFTLIKLKTCAGGFGCNEFVLLKPVRS